MSNSSEQSQLIASFQAGDDAAFRQLVQQYLPVIYAYAVKMISNEADATDVSQEVFVRFWERRQAYDCSKASLNTWLHQVAHNLCIDHFRRQSRLENLEGQEEQTGHSLEQGFESRQQQIKVEVAIHALPERQRNALVLCHYQGLSNKQAAEIMDVSVDALESLLSRARRTLKSLLRGEIQ